MMKCKLRRDSSPRRPVDKPIFDQIGLIDLLDRPGILADRRRQRIQSHRAAGKLFHDRRQKQTVGLIQTVLIHFQKIQRERGDLPGDLSVIFHLGKIAYPLQETVGKPRGASGTSGEFKRTVLFNLYIQYGC